MRDVKEVVVSCSMGLPSSAGLVVTQSSEPQSQWNPG